MYTNRIDTVGNPIYEEINEVNINLIDKTDDHDEILKYCPYCGEINHIQTYYTTNNTTGVIHCIKCGYELP